MSIEFLDILNSDSQLGSFPVGEAIELLFYGEPSMHEISNDIVLVRIDENKEYPNLGDIFVHKLDDNSLYETVKMTFTAVSEGDNTRLIAKPISVLSPNSTYWLAISQGLSEKTGTVTKTTSFGPSNLKVFVEEANQDTATYTLTMTANSNIGGGTHVIQFNIDDGNTVEPYTVSIPSTGAFKINENVTLIFDKTLPYLIGEEFEIATIPYNELGTDKIFKIKTFTSTSSTESPEEESSRLSQQDVLDFYYNTNWASRADAAENPATSNISGKFIYPNKIILTFDTDIDYSSITDTSFSFSISEAFENYMLSHMGLYDASAKYVISISENSSNSILIEVNESSDENQIDKIVLVIN